LLRFISLDVSFHFIHAADIAKVVEHLLTHDVKERDLVLGNQLITADQFITQLCQQMNKKIYFHFKISPVLVKALFGHKMPAWDRYCLEKRHFAYQVVNPASFGLQTRCQTVADVLTDLI